MRVEGVFEFGHEAACHFNVGEARGGVCNFGQFYLIKTAPNSLNVHIKNGGVELSRIFVATLRARRVLPQEGEPVGIVGPSALVAHENISRRAVAESLEGLGSLTDFDEFKVEFAAFGASISLDIRVGKGFVEADNCSVKRKRQ